MALAHAHANFLHPAVFILVNWMPASITETRRYSAVALLYDRWKPRVVHLKHPSGRRQGASTLVSMKLFRSHRIILAAFLCSVSVIAAALAVAQDVPVFRADVGVVNIFFNVKDKHGALVPNLAKDDFQLFEDGKPQPIKYFRLPAYQPLTLRI